MPRIVGEAAATPWSTLSGSCVARSCSTQLCGVKETLRIRDNSDKKNEGYRSGYQVGGEPGKGGST
ncbi:hypothetical protein J6590_103612 [Homalodisca vitripennis]|nr:hypothetical protein J6590_103612 [Homalodisca vitripennis]